MKILYHHRTLGDGAEGIHIREMVSAFRRLGHDVRVVALVGEEATTTSGQAGQSKKSFWNTISRWIPGRVYEIFEIAYNFFARRAVRQAIKDYRPDFIFDRYNCYSIGAIDAARNAGVPVILEVNAPVAHERSQYEEKLPLKFPKLALKYERRILTSVDHLYTVSTPLRTFLIEERGVPGDRVTVIPNGANPESFDPSVAGSMVRSRFASENDIVIGFVGILRPWHGIDILLAAFACLVGERWPVRLLIVGDGPIESELREEAQRLDVGDRVTFTGRVPHAEMASYVAAMDIAVSPRATFYASPMKILEYMAMGVPTVGPRMPNIEDIVRDGHDGLLFTPENIESLAGALRRLVEDNALRQSIGQNARQSIETNLNWANNARRVVDIAEDLIRSKPVDD